MGLNEFYEKEWIQILNKRKTDDPDIDYVSLHALPGSGASSSTLTKLQYDALISGDHACKVDGLFHGPTECPSIYENCQFKDAYIMNDLCGDYGHDEHHVYYRTFNKQRCKTKDELCDEKKSPSVKPATASDPCKSSPYSFK